MSYKARNIIVLSAFLAVILLVSGFFVFYYYPSKIGGVEGNIKNLKRQIAALDGIEKEFYQLDEILKTQEKKFARWDKVIRSSVSPASTYRYLNHIMNYCGFIEFNLYYSDTKEGKGYRYNVFRIKGEGSFWRIYRLISYIENGPEFYKIKNLNTHLVEEKDVETGKTKIVLPFEIELWALYADVEDLPEIDRTLADVRIRDASNPFHPYIYGSIPPNTDNLLDVSRAELKAVLPGKVMIADNTGKIHVLRVGDEVYLGYLSRILLEKNAAEFVLNKAGIVERTVLHLRFDEKIN